MLGIIKGFALDNLLIIVFTLGVLGIALSWRSDLIEKGEIKAVQRIEKREEERAVIIRRAAKASLDNEVGGKVDPNTID